MIELMGANERPGQSVRVSCYLNLFLGLCKWPPARRVHYSAAAGRSPPPPPDQIRERDKFAPPPDAKNYLFTFGAAGPARGPLAQVAGPR
jgi:hypothetical protein